MASVGPTHSLKRDKRPVRDLFNFFALDWSGRSLYRWIGNLFLNSRLHHPLTHFLISGPLRHACVYGVGEWHSLISRGVNTTLESGNGLALYSLPPSLLCWLENVNNTSRCLNKILSLGFGENKRKVCDTSYYIVWSQTLHHSVTRQYNN